MGLWFQVLLLPPIRGTSGLFAGGDGGLVVTGVLPLAHHVFGGAPEKSPAQMFLLPGTQLSGAEQQQAGTVLGSGGLPGWGFCVH